MQRSHSRVVRSTLVAAACAALLVALNGLSARAQAPGGTATTLPPSWFGVWSGAGTPPGFPPAENTKAQLEGGGNFENAYIYKNLRPWAQQRYHTTEWELDDLGQRCQLMGIFRQGLGGGATFRFIESTPGKFYRTSGTYEETGLHTVRFGSTTPLNFRPVYQGDFRSRWEGETLIIESQGYNDKTWILTDRWPHTESFRVIERYRLVGDGSYLELRLFMDDHRAFANPMTFTRYYRKAADPDRSTENICNPQEEGENLWWMRYQYARDEHQAILDAFMKKTLEGPKAPAYSGPAIMGPAGGGGGRGGGGARGGGAPEAAPGGGRGGAPEAAPGGGRGGGGRGGGRGAAAPPAEAAPAAAPAEGQAPEYPEGAPAAPAPAQGGRGGGRGAGAPAGGGRGGAAAPAAAAPAVPTMSAADSAKIRTFLGVWRLSEFNATLPGGVKNQGTLLDIPLTPAGIAEQRKHDVANDPGKFCQSVGPFRMLARLGNALEITPTTRGALMVFENTSVGNKRDIIFNRDHLANMSTGGQALSAGGAQTPAAPAWEPNWHGDSIGKFEGDTLVISTRGFNTRTWLNDAAAQHTTNLRMTERYRLIPTGNLLEVRVTIEDPEFVRGPYTYTRYYQRGADFEEVQCFADMIK